MSASFRTLCVAGIVGLAASAAASAQDRATQAILSVLQTLLEDPPSDRCANTVSDDVIVDTVWRNTPADCDYLVVPRNTGDPIAPGRAPVAVIDARLTIEPGVTVRFAEDGSISVQDNGALEAVGTPAERIRFESATPIPGFGQGIEFASGSLASRIEYADLVNLGEEESLGTHDAAIAGSRFSEGLTLKHSTVSGSSTSGALFDVLPIIEFQDNTFFGNAEYGLVVSARQIQALDPASDFRGEADPNGLPYVYVDGVGSRASVIADARWPALNAPYFVGIAIQIDGGDIEIDPGARFVFGEGARVRVDEDASLRAVGTPSDPIVFTGGQQTPGYWDNIVFFESDSTRNRLEHVEVSYAGRGTADASIEVLLGAEVTIRQSTITDSAAWGVCVDRFSDADLDDNRFLNNRLGDITFDC